MKGKTIYIAAVFFVILLAGCVFSFFKAETRGDEKYPNVEISMRVSKSDVLSVLEEKGIRLSGKALMATSFIPDTLTLTFNTETNGKGTLSDIKINGRKLPHEILSDLCENYLDFECDLVYN